MAREAFCMAGGEMATREEAIRFGNAMYAWQHIILFLAADHHTFDSAHKAITCNECKAVFMSPNEFVGIGHEEGCHVAKAEEGLEILRKLATR